MHVSGLILVEASTVCGQRRTSKYFSQTQWCC